MRRKIDWRRRRPSFVDQIAASKLFDEHHYSAAVGQPFPTRAKAIQHFLQAEVQTARDPHPAFSSAWYRETYPDIAARGVNPLLHFIQFGAREGRSPSAHFDTQWYLQQYPDVAAAGLNPLEHYLTHGWKEGRDPSAHFSGQEYLAANPDVEAAGLNPLVHLISFGLAEGRACVRRRLPLDSAFAAPSATFARWRRHALTRHRARKMRSVEPCRRLIVVLDEAQGRTTQTGEVFADAARNHGIPVTVKGIEALTGPAGIGGTRGEVYLFVRQGDTIDGIGLEALVGFFHTEGQLFTFDTFHDEGEITVPILQPGANSEYLRNVDATFSRFAIRGELLGRVLRTAQPDGARAILLGTLELLTRESRLSSLAHLAVPVLAITDPRKEIEAGRRTLATRRLTPIESPAPSPSVSVIICTKDKCHLLDQLVSHLLAHCAQVKEILVVSNRTSNDLAKESIAYWRETARVTVLTYDGPFNFSDQCNVAAAAATGDLLLFLNDDIVPIRSGWLDRMVRALEKPGVGIVGPLLLYPDETVQHAGMHLGFHRSAGHTLRHAVLPEGDYQFMAMSSRDVSCVTGAALLMRRSCFADLNGFDEQLRSIYQDVDLCLRVGNLGLRILYVPEATLLHMESVSIAPTLSSEEILAQRLREQAYFVRRHETALMQADPFFNPCFDPTDESLHSLTQ